MCFSGNDFDAVSFVSFFYCPFAVFSHGDFDMNAIINPNLTSPYQTQLFVFPAHSAEIEQLQRFHEAQTYFSRGVREGV